MRSRFDEQLALLNRELIEMGALCEEVIALSAQALTEGNAELAARVAPLDQEIDRKEREIESLCLKLLLQQQPVAKDLRQISAALKMITDMERIGDQAEDIAEIITFLGGRGAENSNLLREMARSTIKMVTESVDAYVKHDTALADQVIAEDDTVDDYFARVKKDLIKRIAQDPDDGEFALDLLMIAKYFERIGDHATNIAEWVIFSVTKKKCCIVGSISGNAYICSILYRSHHYKLPSGSPLIRSREAILLLLKEILQLAASGRMSQLAQRFRLNLTNTFTRNLKFLANLFQCSGLSIDQAKTKLNNLAFTVCQRIQCIHQFLLQHLIVSRIRW